jgi:ABC-type transport system involved in multi-copper enzyme maturation permease subunit
MDSNASSLTLGHRLMPFLAILRYDLKTLTGSWMVRLWLAGTALLTMVILLINWASLPTSLLIATLLFPYLILPWFLVVMVLGVEPVAGSRVEVLADGILSRPVTRYEYLLAVWAARVALVLGGYLLVMVPAVILVTAANRRAPEDHVTLYGVVASLAVVGLVLTLQVSLAFLAGTVLRRPLLAVVVLLACWYPVDAILDAFSLESFSPVTLNRALPFLLHQPWRADAVSKEGVGDLAALVQGVQNFADVFRAPSEPPPPRHGSFFRGDFHDFSLFRVILGYGLPTLACVGLATLSFCLRDL